MLFEGVLGGLTGWVLCYWPPGMVDEICFLDGPVYISIGVSLRLPQSDHDPS